MSFRTQVFQAVVCTGNTTKHKETHKNTISSKAQPPANEDVDPMTLITELDPVFPGDI